MGLGDKKKIVTIILLFFAFGLYAQERFIKDNVSQNIMFYNICKSNYIERVKEHIKNQTVGNRFYSDYFIPPKGTELKLDVYRCEDIQYPVEGYSIYGIKKEGYFYFNDSIMYKRDCIDCYFYYDNFFLVAYNAEREKILFLSGNFFIDSIEDDFEFDINNPQTFYNYLRIKCFRYQIDGFEFVKKKGHTRWRN